MTTPIQYVGILPREPNPDPAKQAGAADEAERKETHFLLLVSRVMRGKAHPLDLVDELKECGRTVAELEAALAANSVERNPAPSPAAKVCPPVPKENKMSVYQQTKQQWDAAIRQYAEQHPRMSATACISAVAKQNPELHERLVRQANAERVERRNKS
jgi:hypothetical protein